jgi:hypothetical protein
MVPRINQLATLEKLKVQEPAIPDIVEFAAIFDKGPRCSEDGRFTCGQMRRQVHDVVAALETTVMPDDDLVLPRDALRRDVPDLEHPPLSDRPYDAPIGKGDPDVAATARKRCHLHRSGGWPYEGDVVTHRSLPMHCS